MERTRPPHGYGGSPLTTTSLALWQTTKFQQTGHPSPRPFWDPSAASRFLTSGPWWTSGVAPQKQSRVNEFESAQPRPEKAMTRSEYLSSSLIHLVPPPLLAQRFAATTCTSQIFGPTSWVRGAFGLKHGMTHGALGITQLV